jgi:uncharacterized glyoxalase superfamily protein PhnB
MKPFQRDGWHAVTPRIFVADVEGLIAYMRTVFDATGQYDPRFPAEMKIGDSIVMVSGNSERESTSACLYVYVEDTDATYQRAIAAGATSMEEPDDMPYGDRRSMVRDPWGNIWQIATFQQHRQRR